jgi:hypothetical protein
MGAPTMLTTTTDADRATRSHRGSRRWSPRHGRLDASQSRLQRCFLGVIKRSLQHCTAFALETLKHLVRSDLPYQDDMGTDALTFKAVGMSLGLCCVYQKFLLDHHIAAAAWHSKQCSQRQVASVRIS